MVPRSRASWKQSKVRYVARSVALTFAVLGLVPLEVIVPPLAADPIARILIVKFLVGYFILYVFALTKSLRLLWCFDRPYLERMRIPFTKMKVGARTIRVIERMQPLRYSRNWPALYKMFYVLGMFVFGVLPYVVKFGIALHILKPTRIGFTAMVVGTTIRSMYLVYIGGNIYDRLFH